LPSGLLCYAKNGIALAAGQLHAANGIPSKLFSDSCALPLEYSLHCLRSLIPIDL
jgi:hypothetical protein